MKRRTTKPDEPSGADPDSAAVTKQHSDDDDDMEERVWHREYQT